MNEGAFKRITVPDDALLVDIKSLKILLQCGEATARKIGDAANAKIKVGKSARWDINKIKKYISELNTGEIHE